MATNNAINQPQLTTNGQLVIGSTSATPVAATLTAGSGISITNGAGSITVASTGGGVSWTEVTGTSATMAVNNGYVANNAGVVTLTIPATAAIGDSFRVAGKGAGGWLLQANTGQTVHLGSSVTSSAGALASTNQWDSINIVCVTANTVFTTLAAIGSLTVT